MKKIDVAAVWDSEMIFYYQREGKKSVEQFCVDVIVPELKRHDEPLLIDFSQTKLGISIQKVWILGTYLISKAGFSPSELEKRIILKEEGFSDIQDEFLSSIRN